MGTKNLAQKFFQPQRRVGNKFDDVEFYLGETGCPIISDSPGHRCQVVGAVDKGDHTALCWEVIAAGVREGEPFDSNHWLAVRWVDVVVSFKFF